MLRLIFIFTILVLIEACSGVPRQVDKGSIDVRLVGTWVGMHVRKDGTVKKWKQIRHENGEYVIIFEFNPVEGVDYESADSGKWWVSGELFHEINEKWADTPFIYKYEFYAHDCLKFYQVSRDKAGDEYNGYTFTECKINEQPITSKSKVRS